MNRKEQRELSTMDAQDTLRTLFTAPPPTPKASRGVVFDFQCRYNVASRRKPPKGHLGTNLTAHKSST